MKLRSIAAGCGLATCALRAAAQAPARSSTDSSVVRTLALGPAARREVVDSVTAQVARAYVDADTAGMIADRLRSRARSGAYDAITDPWRFAELLTTELRSVNHDLHLRVSYAAGADGTQPGRGGPRLAGLPDDRAQHYLIGRLDVLPGNVGYLAMDGFSPAPQARELVVSALRYLESTDAIILDLRRNRGGAAGMVNFLISHFVGADTLASVTVKTRAGARTFTRYTLASVPGPRRPTVPLYVLTSRSTGSAAEDCAFVLQNLRRATIVGDRTAGAGHNVAEFPAALGFQTWISVTRVSDPRTGREWEGVGVQPDVRADADNAADVAYALALETLAAHADGAPRHQIALALETAEARLHPHAVPASRLAVYSGEYEGNRRVTIAGGTLVYEPSLDAPRDTLVALSDSLFARNGTLRIAFEHDERGRAQLRTVLPDGGSLTYARVSPARGVNP